jgi:hypothetical protein
MSLNVRPHEYVLVCEPMQRVTAAEALTTA